MHNVSELGVFFNPKSVAIVGASADPKKPGNTALKNLVSMGYKGRVFPINPREETILGFACHRNLLEIPEPVELCVLMVSAELTMQVAKELAIRKSRFNDVLGAVCMSTVEYPDSLARVAGNMAAYAAFRKSAAASAV
jgi:acyl-CoA synthetase (NDP forming)